MTWFSYTRIRFGQPLRVIHLSLQIVRSSFGRGTVHSRHSHPPHARQGH